MAHSRLGACASPAAVSLVLLLCGCGPGPPSLFDVPFDRWPLAHLETYALESAPVLDELRARAARNLDSERVLDRVYDLASVLAFSGDESAYDVLIYGVRNGDRSALFRYGEFLLGGASVLGFEPQPEAALRSLLRAEGLGSEPAVRFLCEGFVHGWDGFRPVFPSPGGRIFCERAARSGEPNAVRLLGDLHRLGVDQAPDVRQAFRLYLVAGSGGSGHALYEIGLMAQAGVPGIPADPTAAASYFIRAVQLGEFRALMPAIILLETGPPEVRDFVRAFSLWEHVWEEGRTAGAWGMSRAFRCGLGVSVSPVESRYWSDAAESASEADPQAALFARGVCPQVVAVP